MTFDQIVSSITSLPPDQQLRVVNAVWDQLPSDVGAILPNDEATVLNDRWQRFLNDPGAAISEQSLRASIQERRKK